MTIRIGIYLSQTTDADNIAQARAAEEAGLDAVWLSDVLAGPERLEALSLAAMLLAATDRVSAGINVINVANWYPQTIVRAAATLDAVSGGRFVLGLGAGYRPHLDRQRAWGYPVREPAAAHSYFEEVVRYVEAYFRDPAQPREGEYVRSAGTAGSPYLPGRRPPIYIGGSGRSVMRVAARHADLWDGMGGWHAGLPEDYTSFFVRKLGQFRELCAEVGRDPAEVRICQTIYAALAATRELAEAQLADAELAVAARPPVVGTAEDLVALLLRQVELGAREFQVFPVGLRVPGRPASEHLDLIRTIGREVAPVVRQAAS